MFYSKVLPLTPLMNTINPDINTMMCIASLWSTLRYFNYFYYQYYSYYCWCFNVYRPWQSIPRYYCKFYHHNMNTTIDDMMQIDCDSPVSETTATSTMHTADTTNDTMIRVSRDSLLPGIAKSRQTFIAVEREFLPIKYRMLTDISVNIITFAAGGVDYLHVTSSQKHSSASIAFAECHRIRQMFWTNQCGSQRKEVSRTGM